jgi:hypothetical protein
MNNPFSSIQQLQGGGGGGVQKPSQSNHFVFFQNFVFHKALIFCESTK